MKKLYLITTLLLTVAAVTLFTGCEEITGDKPTNVVLSAATDTTVMITWAAPANAPDKYIVYFKALGQATYTNLDEVTTTTYTHDPAGATGDYYVTAKFGSNTYDSDVKTTIPIHEISAAVGELNATALSGYGWSRTDGAKALYSMIATASAPNTDFYITNFASGFTATPYYIASPDVGRSSVDSTLVPAATWRVNAISLPITTSPITVLPQHSSTAYHNYQDIPAYPTYVAVKTADGYYALVKVDGPPTANGEVQIESWFQLVEGLRLIKH
jgi:hypothetical protein